MAHLARGRGTIVARTPAVPTRARRKGIADQCGLPLERDCDGNRSAHANAFFDPRRRMPRVLHLKPVRRRPSPVGTLLRASTLGPQGCRPCRTGPERSLCSNGAMKIQSGCEMSQKIGLNAWAKKSEFGSGALPTVIARSIVTGTVVVGISRAIISIIAGAVAVRSICPVRSIHTIGARCQCSCRDTKPNSWTPAARLSR
jgi:hypothetical protein